MTNTPNPSPIDHIAAYLLELLESDIDILELLTLMRALIAPTLMTDIAHALELCPMHLCDYRICADDDIADCADIR